MKTTALILLFSISNIALEYDQVKQWEFCFKTDELDNCIKLSEKTDLYQVLDILPNNDSITSNYSIYHDEYIDEIHFDKNNISFNSRCKLIGAQFYDRDLNLVLDKHNIQIGNNINLIRKQYNKSANSWRNHLNYKNEENGALLLDLVNGNYLSIAYNNMAIRRISLITEM